MLVGPSLAVREERGRRVHRRAATCIDAHVVDEPAKVEWREGEERVGADTEAKAHALASQSAEIQPAGKVALADPAEDFASGQWIVGRRRDSGVVAVHLEQRPRVGPTCAALDPILQNTAVEGLAVKEIVIKMVGMAEVHEGAGWHNHVTGHPDGVVGQVVVVIAPEVLFAASGIAAVVVIVYRAGACRHRVVPRVHGARDRRRGPFAAGGVLQVVEETIVHRLAGGTNAGVERQGVGRRRIHLGGSHHLVHLGAVGGRDTG